MSFIIFIEKWKWGRFGKSSLFFSGFANIMVAYPRPPARRASYWQARRRRAKTASFLGIGPCWVMLTVRFWWNFLLIQYIQGGINLFFGLICLPGDGLQLLCSCGAPPYRQCPKCHLWSKKLPKNCEDIGIHPPCVAGETEMDVHTLPKWWCFHRPWKSHSHVCFLPTIQFLGGEKKVTPWSHVSVGTALC